MQKIQSIRYDLVIEGFCAINSFTLGKDFTHPPERHPYWEMVCVERGTAVALTEGTPRRLDCGEMIFHRPGELHAHGSDRKAANRMIVVCFVCQSPAMEFFAKKTFLADDTAQALLSHFIREAGYALGGLPSCYEEEREPDFADAPFGSVQLLASYFSQLLIHLIRTAACEVPSPMRGGRARLLTHRSLVDLITEYMQENPCGRLRQRDLCARFLIGKSQLCSIFDEVLGQSPMQYYRRVRMEEAKRRLCEGETVSEVSEALGFSCIHSFSRSFKEAIGISPTRFVEEASGMLG